MTFPGTLDSPLGTALSLGTNLRMSPRKCHQPTQSLSGHDGRGPPTDKLEVTDVIYTRTRPAGPVGSAAPYPTALGNAVPQRSEERRERPRRAKLEERRERPPAFQPACWTTHALAPICAWGEPRSECRSSLCSGTAPSWGRACAVSHAVPRALPSGTALPPRRVRAKRAAGPSRVVPERVQRARNDPGPLHPLSRRHGGLKRTPHPNPLPSGEGVAG